nr:hypothetical protein [Sulfuracidifex metallicus]
MWEEQPVSPKGLELSNESSLSGTLWLPRLRFNPESMVGMMNRSHRNPRPSRGGIKQILKE